MPLSQIQNDNLRIAAAGSEDEKVEGVVAVEPSALSRATRRNNLDTIRRHYADPTLPPFTSACEYSPRQRSQSLRYGWMNTKQHYSASRNGLPALQGDLQEVFVERQDKSPFRFGALDED
jgi:hypothetical protein